MPTTLAPNDKTLQWFIFLAISAEYGSKHKPHFIPLTLLAAIDIPTPDPQIKIPSDSGS